MSREDLVGIGAQAGLVMGAIYAVWLAIQESGPTGNGWTPALALGLGYVAPFAAALAGRRVRDPARRVAVWLGCGMLGIVLSITSLSGITLPFLVPSALILAGAISAQRQRAGRGQGADLAVVIGIILLGTASVVVVRVLADGIGAAIAVLGWLMIGAWLLAMLSMDRRRDLGVRP